MFSKLTTYWHTLKYLRPAQVWGRMVNLAKRGARKEFAEAPEVRKVPVAIPQLDLDKTVNERFGLDELCGSKLKLLNQTVQIAYDAAHMVWLKPLIQFNLQYFEYAVALAAEYKRTGDKRYADLFGKYYRSYLSAGNHVHHAYVIALHIPNVLIALELFGDAVDGDLRKRIYAELYTQYRHLERRLERHLMANHYFEDLKALVIASHVFGEDAKCRKYLRMFRKECQEEILPDGMHFELSPMYHKIIWEDLLRVYSVLGGNGNSDLTWLRKDIIKMAEAGAFLEQGICRTPLFSDGGDNVAKPFASLLQSTERLTGAKIKAPDSLPDAGYYRLQDGPVTALIDCGRVGVDYNPAHGHNDCLSFELFVDGKPLFVNQGTYEYQGERRMMFKRTAAHNTVTINGHEQNEMWSGFRVGRRILDVRATKHTPTEFSGQYRNMFGETHQRTITLRDNTLTVLDTTPDAPAGTTVVSYLHLAPGYIYKDGQIYRKADNCPVANIQTINVKIDYVTEGDLTLYAQEFGRLEQASCLRFTWRADSQPHGYRLTLN